MKLGYACLWGPVRETTWSGTPWALRAALQSRADVVDVEAELSRPETLLLKAAYARRVDGRWTSTWRSGVAARGVVQRRLRSAATRADADVVIQIQDLGSFDQPYVLYQDLSYGVLLDHRSAFGELPHFSALSLRRLMALAARQRAIYAGAAGILVMSEFMRTQLVEREGIDADRVAVARPGIRLAALPSRAALAPPEEIGLQILMVSRDFYTKGGDVVVEALRVIRADHDPRATLTVLGPARWPLAGDPPDGVDFVGAVPRERVPDHLARAHVFAMPSRLEGYGMALVEALACGVPCVARRAFAMPEIVEDGVDGVLVDELSAGAVAAALVAAGSDRAMRGRAEQRAASVRETHTWDQTATVALDAITRWTG